MPRAHHGHHQPHAAPAQVLDLRRPPLGAVVAPPSPRPLQSAQLARARPPDSPRLLPVRAPWRDEAAARAEFAPGKVPARHVPRLRLRSGGAGLDPARADRGGEPPDPPIRGPRLRMGNGRLRTRRRPGPARACASPRPPSATTDFVEATSLKGRIFNVHVRRATMGGLALENTHPFCLGSYSFGHNGTILRYPRLLEHPRVAAADGRHGLRGLLQLPDDDLRRLRPDRVAARARSAPPSSARRSAASTSCSRTATACSPTGSACSSCTGCSGPASCWSPPSGSRTSSGTPSSRTSCWCSTRIDLDQPHAERLIGDELLEQARVQKVDTQAHLRGEARGAAAAERARAAVADS